MGDAAPPPPGFEERIIPEDEIHPPTLEQNNPWFLSQVVYYVIAFVTQNGWLCVGLAILVYYLWSKFQPKVQELKARRELDNEAAEYHKNPDKFIAKERAIAAARQRMQDEYNRSSEKHLEDLKLREEQKRQQRLEENDRKQATIGGGAGAGRRLNELSNSASSNTTNKSKDNGKPRLRPEYNPLMSDYSRSSSSGWRPARRTGGG